MQRIVGEIFRKNTCFVIILRQLDLLVFREDNSDGFIMKNATVQVGQGSGSLMVVGHLQQSVVFLVVKNFYS